MNDQWHSNQAAKGHRAHQIDRTRLLMRPGFGSVAASLLAVERLSPATAGRYRHTNCWPTHSRAARRMRPGCDGANRAVRKFGAPLGRSESGRGAPMIWRPKPGLMRLIKPKSA